jgi:hypothetical protein
MTDVPEITAPEACQLPLLEQPLRLAEFDALFARGLRAQQRLSPTMLRWIFEPGVEATARDLTARETACCSFFTFDFTVVGDEVGVQLVVRPAQVKVLDALATRASIGLAAS